MRWIWLVLLVGMAGTAAAQERFSGLGFVNDDGSLRVSGRTVDLYGIYIPTEDETCYEFLRPILCGPRSVLALKLKVDGFVHCREVPGGASGHEARRSVTAVCRVDVGPFSEGEDLAAYLLRNGLALARPGAPFEYHALERIARNRYLGVWGIPVD